MDHIENTLFPPIKEDKILSGKYEIKEVIANSNYGRIYKGTYKGQNKLCAVKEIYYTTGEFTPEITTARKNFDRDVSIISALSHPSIPRIIDHFSDGLRHYLIMEYIEGKNLYEKYRSENRLWSQEEIVAFSQSIASILEYFHHKNFFFHNLHPEHIMIDREGKIKLVSFSMTEHFRSKTMQTPYVAPEVYKKGEKIGIKTDIYSLGVLMYYLAGGNEPEQSHPFNFSKIKEVNSNISDKFINIISKCTSFSMGNRYSSIKDLVKELETFPVPGHYKKLFPVEKADTFSPPAVISPGQVVERKHENVVRKNNVFNIRNVRTGSKITVNELSGKSLFIEVPGRGIGNDWGEISMMVIWIIFWTFGGLVAIVMALKEKKFFVFLWLIFWVCGEYFVGNQLMSNLTITLGKITFLFTKTELKIEVYWAGIIPMEVTYSLDKIKKFNIITTELTGKNSIPKAISIDYNEKTETLPINISVEENRWLCEELNKVIKFLKR